MKTMQCKSESNRKKKKAGKSLATERGYFFLNSENKASPKDCIKWTRHKIGEHLTSETLSLYLGN